MNLKLSLCRPFSAALPLAMILAMVAVASVTSTAQAGDADAELAEMDAAASLLKTIRSWVSNEPEAAIHAFKNYDGVRVYLDQKYREYSGAPLGESSSQTLRPFVARAGDRMKAIEAGIREWEEFLPKYHESQPKQIATELKRQRDAVERYRKSKSPRPSSFAYIPKTVWQTKDKLDVLTASGADTKELQAEQQEVQTMVLDLLASLDVETIAKKNGYIRDAYKQGDRAAIEAFVAKVWASGHPDEPVERIVMPKASWSNSYSARVDEKSQKVVPYEVDRVTVYVATKKTDSILTLNPVRLMREHYRVNGKRFRKDRPSVAPAHSDERVSVRRAGEEHSVSHDATRNVELADTHHRRAPDGSAATWCIVRICLLGVMLLVTNPQAPDPREDWVDDIIVPVFASLAAGVIIPWIPVAGTIGPQPDRGIADARLLLPHHVRHCRAAMKTRLLRCFDPGLWIPVLLGVAFIGWAIVWPSWQNVRDLAIIRLA